jgi:transposase InsO family protein
MVASKILSVKDEATMTPKSVGEYAEALRPEYLAGNRREKGRILTEFCKITGYHRDSAIRLLRHPPKEAEAKRRGRPRIYGVAVREALRQVWEAGDRASGKLLVGVVGELVESMEGCGEIALAPEVRCQLLALSSATIDRLLKPYRELSLRRPYAQTRSVSAFRTLVPVRTFGEWEHVAAGSVQMDLVSHCGESTEGFYLTSLVAVDVATGWHDCRAVWGKGKTRVGGAAEQIRRALPFPLREVHTDNGGEFLNDSLYDWCTRHGIRFTRGRPYKKNDQAYVEQKNWTLVRRRLGWDRFSSKAAFEALERVYRPLRLYTNFFRATRKVIAKERVGAKVVKHYDAARTPYQRLLESKVLEDGQRTKLEALYRSLNPVKLQAQIEAGLEVLWKLAERPAGGNRALGRGDQTA